MGQLVRDWFGMLRRKQAAIVVVVAALGLLASACSSSDESVSFDAAEAVDAVNEATRTEEGEFFAEEEAMEDEEFAEEEFVTEEPASEALDDDGGDPAALGAGGTQVTPTAADLGRQLIFTAFVSVEVQDVATASAEATTIIEDLGGFLFGQNTTGGTEPSSELIFKVLPDDFNQALERLGSVGELRNQSVSTDDVTERIVDLESRIEVAELGVVRLREALDNAPNLEDFAEIERLLLDRESDLEVMRGSLRTLQDRIDLATITLTLTQDRIENNLAVQVTGYDGFDGGQSCPGQELGSVEAGSDITVCFELINVGDQTLTGVVLTDPALEITSDTELLAVFGSLEEIAPGQSTVVAFETELERTVRLRTRAVAVPTDGSSSEPVGPTVSTQVNSEIRTFEPQRDPSFGDGFGLALSILAGLWVALRWLAGFLIPLLILVPFIWLALWGLRALRARRPQRPSASGPPSTPPPNRGPMPPPPSPQTTGPQAAGSPDALGSTEPVEQQTQ